MKIKYSKRGLTFSFKETETLRPGMHYRYIIDTEKNEIVLIADEEGKYILSKKGATQKPLVDLRSKEIREAISMAKHMEITITSDTIIVHVIKKDIFSSNLSDREIVDMLDKDDGITFEISKDTLESNPTELAELLKQSGILTKQQCKDISFVYDTISTFSGAGLLDLPFHEDSSFDIRYAIDYDKYACETYSSNIGNHIVCMDIRQLDASTIPNAELIIGGVCCQGYSNANRAGNYKRDKDRRLLVDDYIRIVKEKQPLIFCIENVPEFITKEQGLYLERVLTALSEYAISYSIVTDYELGGYTMRKRMILIGSKIGKVVFPNVNISSVKTAGIALSKVDKTWYNYKDITKPSEKTIAKMQQVRPGHNYKDIKEMSHLDRHSNVYRRLDYCEPAITLTNWRKINLMPPDANRILSVSEAASLMGLTKKFRFFGTLDSKQQQCGNGVTQAIATYAKDIIKDTLNRHMSKTLCIS